MKRYSNMTKIMWPVLVFILPLLTLQGVANGKPLIIMDDNKRIEIPLEELKNKSTTTFSIFAPFRSKEITVSGIYVEDLLQQYLSYIPSEVKLNATDGYEVILKNWKRRHWLVVTAENGIPLTLRNHGPLRVIEREYGKLDAKNLRNFNHWVWMLEKIEAK